MVKLDSIKIKAPNHVLNGFNSDLLERDTKHSKGVLIKDISQIKSIDFGFNSFSLNNLTNDFIIELSAKILKSDYADGINQNNFDRVVDAINKNKFLNINIDAFYNSAELLRADVTDNIKLDYKGNFYSDISAIPLPNKYEITSYNITRNNGVVFKGKQSSFKERQIIYNKLIELNSVKSGKQFLNSVNKNKIYKDFKDTIRVEGNFTEFKKMRQYIGSNKLSDVLQSNEKPNYKLWQKITKHTDAEILYLFDRYEGMNIREVIRRRGLEGIITDAKFNWQYIELWLKNKTPKTYRIHRKEFRKIYLELQLKQNRANGKHIIQLFSDALLKVA
jgi:hypothetical protein